MTISTRIQLHGLELNVYLGWPKAERLQQQTVILDVTLIFAKPPHACVTDNLHDTYCYDTLVSKIKKEVESRKFRLVEHLGCEIYRIIKSNLSKDTMIHLSVTKKPAIPNLTGGISFYYED